MLHAPGLGLGVLGLWLGLAGFRGFRFRGLGVVIRVYRVQGFLGFRSLSVAGLGFSCVCARVSSARKGREGPGLKLVERRVRV